MSCKPKFEQGVPKNETKTPYNYLWVLPFYKHIEKKRYKGVQASSNASDKETMKKSILLLLSFMAITAMASDRNVENQITLKCKGRLEKVDAYSTNSLLSDHTIILDIVKEDEKDPGYISKNGQIEFGEGYNVVYNINVDLGKNGGLFSSGADTTSEIRARLQRDTVGNGKIVIGASAISIKQKAEKKKSKIAIDIINVRALDNLVNNSKFISLEHDPILFKNDFKEAVYTGTLDKGVVKSAHIECLTL